MVKKLKSTTFEPDGWVTIASNLCNTFESNNFVE